MLTIMQVEARKEGIGASESAAALGLNPYCTPYELWLIKTGRLTPEDCSDRSKVYWGNVLEEPVAKEYAKRKNVKIKRVHKTQYHKKYPFILCHPDRKIIGQPKILECKFASEYSKGEWGEEGSDLVPRHYIIQVQHQLAVTDYKEADLAVLIGGHDFRIYPFNRDEEIIHLIIEKLKDFWLNHVKADIPPAVTSRRDLELKHPINNGTYRLLTPEMTDLLQELKMRKGVIRNHELKKQAIENELISLIGDADGIKQDDKIIATWKADKNGKRILRVNERSSLCPI